MNLIKVTQVIGLLYPKKNVTLNEIILLKKYLPEPTLTARIVFKIELIKAMKSTLVCVNVQKVNIEVISVKKGQQRINS